MFNRGIATINLIQALEDKGYIVDLNVFLLSQYSDEYVNITINLKQANQPLNITKCYYPFAGKEFLRRLLFRVLESSPVERNWGRGYENIVSGQGIRKFYKLREKDLVIASPKDMGINGNDVYEDIISLFKNLNLDTEFDLSNLKKKVKTKGLR